MIFTGDLLFAGSIGRTDLPGGDYETILTSLARVCLPLPDETVVLAGHGPQTTIGAEREQNPFLTGLAGGSGGSSPDQHDATGPLHRAVATANIRNAAGPGHPSFPS